MHILCDTCCILMLIRIAPDMFFDERYQCCTIHAVRDEFFRTTKFKSKYPWRTDFKDKIFCLQNEIAENESVNRYFDVITLLLDQLTINERTNEIFDLSYVDRKILACALANGYHTTTGDTNLRDFASQEFPREYKGNISPLGILNRWLRKDLIIWNDNYQEYLSAWYKDNEHPQPANQKRQFKKLTRFNYPGS